MVDYCMLNQMVTQIVVAVSVVTSLAEQINMSPGTWDVAINLVNASLYLLVKANTAVCFQPANLNVLSLPSLEAYQLSSPKSKSDPQGPRSRLLSAGPHASPLHQWYYADRTCRADCSNSAEHRGKANV